MPVLGPAVVLVSMEAIAEYGRARHIRMLLQLLAAGFNNFLANYALIALMTASLVQAQLGHVLDAMLNVVAPPSDITSAPMGQGYFAGGRGCGSATEDDRGGESIDSPGIESWGSNF